MIAEKKKIYVAGPMRGIELYNFPAFDTASDLLEDHGWTVISPADLDREVGFDARDMEWPVGYDWKQIPAGFDFNKCVTRDINALRTCQAIYLLVGWEKSRGACAEKALAEWLGLEVIYQVLMNGADVTYCKQVQEVMEDSKVPAYAYGEVRVTDSDTGGQKGSKLARFDLLPARPLYELTEIYGLGSIKYADRNWEKGYKWSLSFASMMRHAWSFWGGVDLDPELKRKHILCAVWHGLALAEMMDTHPEKDDRVKK